MVLSIEIAKKVAKENNGILISTMYKNARTKLLWKCHNNHKWYAILDNVKNKKTWCPECAGTVKLNINIANNTAKMRDGKCLSISYKNNRDILLWKCSRNHRWMATLNAVKDNNSWCPECSVSRRAKSSNNSYILYHWKTNEELVCQASWEKKVVEHLNKNKINFRWQPRSFKMSNGHRYYPDLYLFSTKKWVEIKGYFRKDAKEKWEWFQTIKPNSELWNEQKLKEMGIL